MIILLWDPSDPAVYAVAAHNLQEPQAETLRQEFLAQGIPALWLEQAAPHEEPDPDRCERCANEIEKAYAQEVLYENDRRL